MTAAQIAAGIFGMIVGIGIAGTLIVAVKVAVTEWIKVRRNKTK